MLSPRKGVLFVKKLGLFLIPSVLMILMVLTLCLGAAQNTPTNTHLYWGDTHLHTS